MWEDAIEESLKGMCERRVWAIELELRIGVQGVLDGNTYESDPSRSANDDTIVPQMLGAKAVATVNRSANISQPAPIRPIRYLQKGIGVNKNARWSSRWKYLADGPYTGTF
jgi:hypothetical protein